MFESVIPLAIKSGFALWKAFYGLIVPGAVFAALAVIVKGRRVFADVRDALPETRINLMIMCCNVVLVAPFIAMFSTWMSALFRNNALHVVSPSVWEWLPVSVVIFIGIFMGDFAGYWRHRIEHTPMLWPSHAVHHSDTEMTWLTLERFHPINFLTTLALDSAFLLLLGLPVYALVANNLVRHYYGYLIHADLPWTYGRLGKVFVSPAMHRWHHAADRAAFNTNYATVFSLFDRWFGTFRVPGRCTAPLGVTDRMGAGVVGQLSYPFRPTSYRRLARGISRRARQLVARGPMRGRVRWGPSPGSTD